MWDIALVKLSAPIPANTLIAKMILDPTFLKPGVNVTLVGQGLVRSWPPGYATEMRKVTIAIDNPQFSTTQFSYQNIGGHGACNGDSGGPAYVSDSLSKGELQVVGVTSWGDSRCSDFGVYTNVTVFGDWINTTISEMSK